jgi:hypothetical protein
MEKGKRTLPTALTNQDAKLRAQLQLQAAAALELQSREREELWRNDAWTWFRDRVTLLDPLAEGEKIGPYPQFDYLQTFVGELQHHKQLVAWKSRRMIASWTGIAWAVYLCTLFPHTRCYFISRKEGENDGEGSRELVWRAKFIAQNLRNGPKVNFEDGKLHIVFPDTESTITGVTSEPDQMRQVSANFVLCDEFGFWPDPKASYAALKPTLESRGRVLMLSSSAEGFFKESVLDHDEGEGDDGRRPITVIPARGIVINDQWDDSDRPRDVVKVENHLGMAGFAAWTNPKNGMRITAWHYTADPRKRSTEWRENEQRGVPRSIWLTEYEMQLGVKPGKAVFHHEWVPELMLKPKILVERGRPIIASLDFGFTKPAFVAMQLRYGVQLCILRAIQGEYVQFERFMEQILESLTRWFPQRDVSFEAQDFVWACDRMGDVEKSTGESELTILKKTYGIRPKFKYSLIPPTLDTIRGYMSRVVNGEPCFLVEKNPTTALIVEALNGRYVYPEKAKGDAANVPVKDNVVDHQMDCIRYGVLNYGGRAGQGPASRAALLKASVQDILPNRNYVLS